jgi:hypothetical protein
VAAQAHQLIKVLDQLADQVVAAVQVLLLVVQGQVVKETMVAKEINKPLVIQVVEAEAEPGVQVTAVVPIIMVPTKAVLA